MSLWNLVSFVLWFCYLLVMMMMMMVVVVVVMMLQKKSMWRPKLHWWASAIMETPIYSSHPHRLLLLLLHLIKGFKAMASFLYFLTHYSVPCFLFMHKAMFLLFLALCFLVSFYLMSSFFHLFLSLSLSHTHAYTHAIFMNSAEKDLKIMCMCIHNV